MVRRIGICCMTLAMLLGCSPAQEQSALQSPQPKQLCIGLSMATLQEERWAKDRDIFVAKAKQAGTTVIVQNADNDADEQLRQVEYLLQQNIDVLVIIPQDAAKSQQSVQAAHRRNVPVLSYDRLVLNANVDAYVSFDGVSVGRKMAESLLNVVPRGNYLIINGSTLDHNSTLFREGYMAALKPRIENGAVHILEETWAKDWRREEAYAFVQAALQKYEKIDAIIAANDSLAEGAIKALAERRLAGEVLVAGHDADLSACQRVVEGTQYVTIYKPLALLAEEAVRVSLLLARKQPMVTAKTMFDGTYDVPFDLIDVVAVDKTNMDETIIKDGFHLDSEVYLNVRK